MKKLFVFLCFCSLLLTAFANPPSSPYSVPAGIEAEEFEVAGRNRVFVFKNLTDAEITLTAGEPIDTVICKTYTTSPAVPTGIADFSVEDTLAGIIKISNLDDATGYVFEINRTTYIYIYVFDYTANKPVLNSLQENFSDCSVTSISISSNVPVMNYYIPVAGSTTTMARKLERNFTLRYKTLRWNENEERFDEVETTEMLSQSDLTNDYTLDSIFIDTKIVLTGDQYAVAFKDTMPISVEIIAKKPIIKSVGELTPRDADNERDKGDDKERHNLKGSAPVEVNLRAHANVPLARDFTWYIYEIQQPNVPFSYSREQSFNLRFSNYGKYVARVTTTTADGCTVTDSVNIEVTESEVDIPNVFTPNGDGINDKFCVAFKSIVKYNMWVYNRWGRLVFTSNSPENCWDGYIGNNKAASGAYFYKIEATGADGITYKRAGDINLLR